jgi:hypothetical protein
MSGQAVGAFDAQADHQAVITHHGGPVVGPIGVFTLNGAVEVDKAMMVR